MNRIIIFLPVVIFLALGVLFTVGLDGKDDSLPSTRIGKTAPVITSAELPGFTPLSADMIGDGEVVLVNFFASWCPPCRAEHPKLMELAAQGIDIIGVNLRDDEENARAFLSKDGNPYEAIAFDKMGRTAIDWGVTAPPETFILSREGKVLFRFQGPLVGSDYEQRFAPELSKALSQ